jgi:hypothetical protein
MISRAIAGAERRTVRRSMMKMSRRLGLFIGILAIAGCASQAVSLDRSTLRLGRLPRLHERLRHLPESDVNTLVSSGQFWPAYYIQIATVKFTLAIDDESRVRFVATSDARFRSPEGLIIGDSRDAAEAAADGRALEVERGWGHYVELPSGWNALLDDSRVSPDAELNLNLGTRDLSKNARITMFFKRG